jgi:hypothetical protein
MTIDTIHLGHPISPTSGQLGDWDLYYKRPKSGHEKEYYWKHINSGKADIDVVYYPNYYNLEFHPLLLIQVSLPKLLYGNNIAMLEQPDKAIEVLSSILRNDEAIPAIDLWKANIYQIAFCYNHQVGEHVHEYVRQLFKLNYPNRRTKPYYPTDGIHYYSRGSTLTFYDKEEESGSPSAYGILRQESLWKGKLLIGELVGKQEGATIKDFTPEVRKSILVSELNEVGLHGTRILGPNLASETLVEAYGIEKGTRLYGFLQQSQERDHKELIRLGHSPSTISQNEKAIRDAGLAMSITDERRELPQLTIDL